MEIDNHTGWYVVFSKTNKHHWLLSRLKGHQHCFAMAKSPGGSYWIVVNPSWYNITVTMLFTEDFPTPESYWGNGVEVIKYKTNTEEINNTNFFGFITCVSVVKRLLGINKRMIVTPNQLARYLHGI